jgi:tetratricopeptide (TPR) repeat protein
VLAHRLAGNIAEAEHLIAFLRGSGPGAVAIDFEHAQLLSDLGRKEEARLILQELVRRQPGVGRAWYMLARLETVVSGDPIVDDVLRTIETAPEPSGPMKFLCYAAGKIFDDLGEYDRAFGYFERAKRQEPQTYDPAAVEALFDAIKATFTEEFFRARSDFGVPSDLPIFIIGLPRTGTTLVEQILASHPDVFGGGELEYLTHAMHRLRSLVPNGHYPQNVSRLRRETAAALAFSYLRKLRRLNSEKACITDKLPHNFMLLGLVRLMFRELKAVHCVRHPFDTCLSLFMQDFVQSHGYNQSLSGLAHYYTLYRELMEHWSSLFGDRILELRYETLVAEQEAQTRRLLDFSGLSWSERVLDFARTPRLVSTPSSWQVRRPMFSTSIGRWTNYRKHVEKAFSAIPQRYLS